MLDLKKQLIRLGSTNPELRDHIKPLLDTLTGSKKFASTKILMGLKKRSKVLAKTLQTAFSKNWPYAGRFKWGSPKLEAQKPREDYIRFNGKRIKGQIFSIKVIVPYRYEGPFSPVYDLVNSEFQYEVFPSFAGKLGESINGYRIHPSVRVQADYQNNMTFYIRWEVPPDSTEVRKHIDYIERDLERMEEELGPTYRDHPEYRKTIDELKEWQSKLAKED